MKKFALLLTAAFAMTLVLDSCSVQKRYHRNGLTINWKKASLKKKENQKGVKSNVEEESIVSTSKKRETLIKKYESTPSIDLLSSVTDSNIPTLNNRTPRTKSNIDDKSQISSVLNTTKKEPVRKNIKHTKKAVKKIIKSIKNKPAEEQKIHWASLTGFITGLVGLFFLPIVLGLCAITFSAIALSQIKRNPELYKGKGFAIAGLIIGIIDVVLVFLILALVLAILL